MPIVLGIEVLERAANLSKEELESIQIMKRNATKLKSAILGLLDPSNSSPSSILFSMDMRDLRRTLLAHLQDLGKVRRITVEDEQEVRGMIFDLLNVLENSAERLKNGQETLQFTSEADEFSVDESIKD